MVRVLMAVTEETAEKNPYLLQLAVGLRNDGIEVQFWNWSSALLKNPDIIHIHWPELLYKGRSRKETVWKSLLTVLVLVRCRLWGIPLVWTVHNQQPHNRLSRVSSFMDRLVRRNIRATISINDADYRPEHVRTDINSKIPHGHYVEWFEKYPPAKATEMAACFVGQVRSYKGVLELVEAFRVLDDPRASLCIAGAPSPSQLGAEIQRHADIDQRISTKLRFLSDEELVATVTSSSIVVLPYTHMFNSGALLLALSLGRPVLAPETEINKLMQEEFGSEWIRLYSGPLSAIDISDALNQGTPSNERPNMDSREWRSVSQLHRSAYEAALRQTNSISSIVKKIGQ